MVMQSLFVKLNGEDVPYVSSPKTPTSPTGTPQCVNLADSCANYLAHWHITLDAAISNDIQELEIISDNGSGILERSVLKFKVSEPPEKFRTTVSPEGTSGDQYNFEFSPYERASIQDMTLLTWNGERYVKYTSGITGTLTYRGRATNWGEGGGGMAWATLYPDGQMIIMINYGKAGAEGKTFTFDTNDSEIFSGFELDDTIEAPTQNAQAEKEISYTWSSHPGAMYKQVWRDDKINNWRDYYDPDIGLTMMLGANNSMDWILARDMNISLNLKTVVLPATDYYLPIPDGGPSQFSTTNLDAYRAWRQNLTDSGGNFQPTAVNVQSDLTYCDTVTQSSGCTGEIPETNLKFIHVVGYGLGGRRDLDAGNFFKMFTNLTRQKAGTGLHELGHTLGLGHCYNQRDTMCGGGGFWFGRDTQKRTKQFISSFTQGGETLRTGTTYAAPLPPYSGEDYHRMTAGTTALIDVVANDVDFNGDTVTISEVDSETFFGGTARIEAGKVRYAPPSGFTGVDYFSYKIQSGTVATNGYFTNTAHASVYVTPADTTEPVVHFNFEEASYDILNNIADLDNTIFAYIKPKSGGSEFTFATPGAKIDGAVGKGFTPTGTSGIILKHYPEPIDQSQTTSMWFNLVDVSGFGADDISILWDSDPSTISVTRVSNEFKLNVKVVPEGSYGLDATFSAALDVTTPNEWHHVALVINREDNTVKAYLDGQEISDGVSGDQPFSNGFATIPGGAIFKGKSTASIGTVNEPGVEEGEDTPDFAASSDDTVFNSAVDEFKIFNRALTPADIESEYNNIASDSTLWRSHDGILSNQLKGGGFNKVGVESSAVSGLNFNTTTSGRVLSIEVSHPDYQGDREYPSEGYEFDERFVEIRNQNGEIGSISRFLGFYKSEIDYSLRFDLAKKRSKNRPAMDFNVWAGGSYADHSGAVKVASASIANNTTSSDPAWVDTTISLNDLGADTSTLSANTPIWLEITNKPGSSEGAASLIDNLVVTVTGLPIDDSDSDGDGVSDADDAFPNDASETADTDGDGVGNNEDTDDDGDGVLDTADAFPLISLNGLTDTDGDGRPNDCDSDCQTLGMTADTDDDGDGVLDTADAFPLISLNGLTDTDGDGRPNDCDSDCQTLGMTADTDDDGDGVLDTADAFPLISLNGLTDTDGDGRPNDCDSDCQTLGMTADTDDDGDGVLDTADAFPLISLNGLTDTDGDGRPNDCDSDCQTLGMTADTDDDGDGVLDTADAFPLISLNGLTDTDGDGRPNDCDSDCQTLGMTADTDDDGDGVLDTADAFPLISLNGLTDTDGDGRPNDCDSDCQTLGMTADTDDDGDGVLDTADAFPLISLNGLTDTDGDGRPNDCDSDCQTLGMTADTDDDGDGVLDTADAFPLISLNGLTDTDGDGRPNDCDSDCQALGMTADTDDDGDGVLDTADAFPLISLNGLTDTDGDGRPNDCDSDCQTLGMTADTDDDGDGVLDTADAFPLISLNGLTDTDGDGRPNDCDSDCQTLGMTADTDDDGDGVLDTADAFPLISLNGLTDTDGDGRPNDCDSDCQTLGMTADTDDDGDGVLDTADAFPLISLNGLTDTDGDGRPNDCDSDCQTLGMTADTDDDGDGVLDTADAFPLISLNGLTDTDGDGRPDDCDSDCQTLGMTADTDDDGDGVLDAADAFPLDASESIDTDSDGKGNNADTDDDGDGVADSADAFPLDATESVDADSDGTGNNADLDDDGDGVPDIADGYALISLGALLDNDSDGFPNDCDEDCLATGMTADSDDDNDGVEDTSDAFPLDASETADSDNDGVGDNSDAFPNDATESVDSDSDSIGDNSDNCPSLSNTDQLNTDADAEGDACDSDDDNDGFSDDQEELDGTDPLSRFSCKSGCFSFDVDENLEAQPLTDGLLVIRHLFGFSGESLTSGAVDTSAERDSSEAIVSYLTDADSELDIDGDGESKPLTDGLLLIRYLFGFSGDSLISGAIGGGAERDTAEEVEAYIKERVPAS